MLAVIGGTGLNTLDAIDGFVRVRSERVATRYGAEPVVVDVVECGEQTLLFTPRHGAGHVVPPHRINYRANIEALRMLGATRIVAMNAVGGIADNLPPGALAVPDQLIDYTWGREATFFEVESGDEGVVHIDFGEPYSQALREQVLAAASRATDAVDDKLGHAVVAGGVYGCTQGPRLETAAEIRRLRADGCTMVGMTGMPEAALAREAGLDYASIALSVNWAAGLEAAPITLEEIYAVVAGAAPMLQATLRELCAASGR